MLKLIQLFNAEIVEIGSHMHHLIPNATMTPYQSPHISCSQFYFHVKGKCSFTKNDVSNTKVSMDDWRSS